MILKNFRNKKLQTLIIALMIVLSTMLVNGALSILLTVKEPIKELKNECQLPEATIILEEAPDALVNEMIKDFEAINGVNNVAPLKRYYSPEEKFLGDKQLDMMVFFSEYNRELLKDIRCIDGNINVDEYQDNECAIPKCVANDQSIQVGDEITVKIANGEKKYKVAGTYADPESIAVAFSNNVYVKQVPELKPMETVLKIDVKDGIDPYKVEAEYRKNHDGKLSGNFYTQEKRVSQQMIVTNILGGIILGIGIASFAVCLMIIAFVVRNAVMSDSKKIAIYKTYGYSYGDILRMYLSYYTGVCFLGAVAGAGLSLIFTNVVLEGVFNDMGAKVSVNPFMPGALTALVITLLTAVCVFLVLRKTKKIKPVFALRGSEPNTKKNRYKGKTTTSFSPFGIALRTILRDKKGAVGILVASIAIVLLSNLGIVALEGANHMENENDFWLGIPSGGIVVEVNDSAQFEEIENYIKSDKNVEKTTAWIIEKPFMLPWKEGSESNVIYAGVYRDYEEAGLTTYEGRNPKTKDEIAISTKMAESLGLKVGDYMEGSIDGENDITFLVTGIFQTYYCLGEYCRLPAAAYIERDIPLEYEKLSVFEYDNSVLDQMIESFSNRFGDAVNVKLRTDTCKSIMTMISSPQKMAIPPVVALIMVIGGVSIFSIVLLKNMKSEKPNQIYKSIGFTTKDLFISNIWYVEIIGIIAMIIGVPTLLLSYKRIMMLALSMFGLKEYIIHINVWTLVIVNGLILISFAVASIISSFRLRKLNVRDLVIE